MPRQGFDVFRSRLTISATLVLLTPLRIGSRPSANPVESNNPVLKDVLGNPVIPGSSLKGALRSYIEMLLRAAALQRDTDPQRLACDFLADKVCLPDSVNPDMLKTGGDDFQIMEHSCLTCRVFGSPYLAAKLAIQDCAVTSWNERYVLRDGVAIDRDTGTAADQRKYDYEAVPAGTRFSFRAQIDNALDEELGLALTAINALQSEQIQIGGARSRGLGWCTLENMSSSYSTDPIQMLLEPAAIPALDDTAYQRAMQALHEVLTGEQHA